MELHIDRSTDIGRFFEIIEIREGLIFLITFIRSFINFNPQRILNISVNLFIIQVVQEMLNPLANTKNSNL